MHFEWGNDTNCEKIFWTMHTVFLYLCTGMFSSSSLLCFHVNSRQMYTDRILVSTRRRRWRCQTAKSQHYEPAPSTHLLPGSLMSSWCGYLKGSWCFSTTDWRASLTPFSYSKPMLTKRQNGSLAAPLDYDRRSLVYLHIPRVVVFPRLYLPPSTQELANQAICWRWDE